MIFNFTGLGKKAGWPGSLKQHCRNAGVPACTLILLLLISAGCDEKQARPVGIMDDKIFAELYANAAMINATHDSVRARVMVDSMLQARKVGSKQLEAAVAYFRKNPDNWLRIWQQITRNISDSTSLRNQRRKPNSAPQKTR